MKIFGLEIIRPKIKFIKDKVPEFKTHVPESTKKPTIIPLIRDPTLGYASRRSMGRGAFASAEYDISEVGRIEDTDGYVRQAFGKKVALMFKEGWTFNGRDPKTLKYIKTRFSQIARASATPTGKLFRDIGSSLVRKSNAFIIKVRKTEASGGKERQLVGKKKTLKPTAAYFIAPAETMEYQLTGSKISKWRQNMPNGDIKFHNTEDVFHFYHDRKDGFIFGTPTIIPVVDDIRALRKIEENIELLVYQHLFPLFQYKVGTENAPAGFNEDGQREIDAVKQEIRYMPTEGGIVTPERHEIIAIGVEGRALRAESYLEHFKKRVFSGLGVSAVDMGEGETANRATADNMSRNMVDNVKDIQQVMELFVNEFMIVELLLESTFGDEVLDSEKIVKLKFKEIDVDAQIKKDSHYADLYAKDAINLDETREAMGREPMGIPTPKEIDSDKDLSDIYPLWYKMRWKLIQEPTLLIQSLDEPYSPQAKALAAKTASEISTSDIESAAKEQKKHEVDIEKEKGKAKIAIAKTRPSVTRPSKPKKVRNGFLTETFAAVKQDVVLRALHENTFDQDWTAQLIRAQMTPTIDRLISEQVYAFSTAYQEIVLEQPDVFMEKISFARRLFRDRAEKYIDRLTRNVISLLNKRVDPDSGSETIASEVRAAFDAVEFRTKFIEDVELRKAYNFGKVQAIKNVDVYTTFSSKENSDNACTRCQSKSNLRLDIKHPTIEDVPPHHANCGCDIVFYRPEESNVIKDSVLKNGIAGTGDDPSGIIPDTEVQPCPTCDTSSIRSDGAPDTFFCTKCKKAFKIKNKGKKKITEENND